MLLKCQSHYNIVQNMHNHHEMVVLVDKGGALTGAVDRGRGSSTDFARLARGEQ